MKKIIFAIAATLCTLGANAQFGIQAGANFTDLKLSDVSMSEDFISSATGYSVGVTYDFDLILGLGINTGLVFIQRNVKADYDGNKSLDRFSSLELPLNAKYTFELFPLVKPFAIAGPYVDCGLWSNNGASYGDELHRFTWGMTLGAGVDLLKHLRVMYQYDWGLSSLTADNVANAVKSKARSNRITLGVLF